MTYNITFSYSAWSMWEKCPRQYKFAKIDKLPVPENPAFVKGRRVHTAMEKWVKGELTERPAEAKLFTALADGLRDVPADLKIVEEQMAFDRDQRPVTWFGKNAFYRYVWDVAVLDDPIRPTHIEMADWKGLALDTPLLGPAGWTDMGRVQAGDCVTAPDGTPTMVTGKSNVKNLRCFEVTFNNNAPPIVCDEEHLWEIMRGGNRRPKIVPVTEMQRGDFIRLPEPVVGVHRDISPRPYVLGCWLGDGHQRDGMITKPDVELFRHIEACGYTVLPVQPSSEWGRTVQGLRGELSGRGLLNNKHIPPEYFTLSTAQRIELLRGIMDTDGSWNGLRRRAILTTVDRDFAVQVQSLAASLGEKATLHTYETTGFGKRVTAYNVDWAPTRFNPFKLSRKADKVEMRKFKMGRTIGIKDVREVPSVLTQCISVDHPSRMYLAGQGLIPTHNTGKMYGSYDAQMQIFSIPAYLRFPSLQSFAGNLIYLESGDSVRTVYTRAQFEGGLNDLWKSNAAMMAADRSFEPKPSRDACRFCDFHAKKGGPCQDGV